MCAFVTELFSFRWRIKMKFPHNNEYRGKNEKFKVIFQKEATIMQQH
jgi:hypothetical protein